MMTNREMVKQQQQLIFKELKGKRKQEFFVNYFESEIAFVLRQMRKEKKLTQADIAKRTGLKQGNISKIENLEKTPTLTTVGKYLFALDFSIEECSEFVSSISSFSLFDGTSSLSFEGGNNYSNYGNEYRETKTGMCLGGASK